MAAQGLRDTDDGAAKILNPEELAIVKRTGRWVIGNSLVSAVVMTVMFVLLP
jgi:hypothetical protein